MPYYESTDYYNLPTEVMESICNSSEWFPETIDDKQLQAWQYESLVRGFAPNLDWPFAPYKIGEWFYIIRSGGWLKKFKFEKQTDGLYHITAHYTTEGCADFDILLEILLYGFFEPPFWERGKKV